MSAQLLKRSLQIVEDKPTKDKSKKKQQDKSKKAKERTNQSKSIEDNLKKLIALSSLPSETKGPKKKKPNFEKLFNNARPGTRSQKLEQEEKARKEAEGSSIFTQEDFLKFEQELFCDK